MTALVLNLLLAIAWCMLTGSASPWNFIAGLIVGMLVVAAINRVKGQQPYIARVARLIAFGWYFLVILTKANLQIARALLTPGMSQKPRIIRYPVAHLTDVQKTTLANAITLTPGTLVVDICPEGRWLYLHCMFAEDRAAAAEEIRDLERNLMQGVFA